MSTRRQFLLALGAGALALPASGQAPAKVWRIGFMGAGSKADMANRIEGFEMGLREFGYVQGRNLLIEYRWAEGKDERFTELATELMRLKVDAIVTHGNFGPLAARRASSTIPIVIAASNDPVKAGLAVSLARPGGNVTGSTFFAPELVAKRVELIREALPRTNRVAILFNPEDPSLQSAMELVRAATKTGRFEAFPVMVRQPSEFESAFASMLRQRANALTVSESVFINLNVKSVAALALKYRIPSVGNPEFAESGGLLGYGVGIPALFRRAAYFVDRIFKGANPGELPIERPTQFDFLINAKTVTALGLNIPPSIRLQASREIG